MLAAFALILRSALRVNAVIVLFGLCIAGAMLGVMKRKQSQRKSLKLAHLLAVEKSRAGQTQR